ncbi:MAG: hypothetical protein WCQ67_03935 [Treponema sp.]
MNSTNSNKEMDYGKEDFFRNSFKFAVSIAMIVAGLFLSTQLHAQTFEKQPDGKLFLQEEQGSEQLSLLF